MEEETLKEFIRQMRDRQQLERAKITLLKAPLTTSRIFVVVLHGYLISWINFFLKHKTYVGLVIGLLCAFIGIYNFDGAHQEMVQYIEREFLIACWWIGLGVLSSIGLGTGLHTFVLYLGPYIAKVTLAAFECASIEFDTYGVNAFICPDDGSVNQYISLWQVLRKVQVAAVLWGAGTAIGELPPYFVARAARLAGQQLEELQEITKDEDHGFAARIATNSKKLMLAILERLGFFGIMLFASIPNPLFDLAGLTCGHFLIPFATFFGATFVGKAIIKTHLQTLFVITMFSKEHLQQFVEWIEYVTPFLKDTIDDFLQKQKAQFHRHNGAIVESQKSVLAIIWDVVLVCMLAYFLISIVNSSVQGYLLERDEEAVMNIEGQKKEK